jgi:hypothetical protein
MHPATHSGSSGGPAGHIAATVDGQISSQLAHGAGGASTCIHVPPSHTTTLQNWHGSGHPGEQNSPSIAHGVPGSGKSFGSHATPPVVVPSVVVVVVPGVPVVVVVPSVVPSVAPPVGVDVSPQSSAGTPGFSTHTPPSHSTNGPGAQTSSPVGLHTSPADAHALPAAGNVPDAASHFSPPDLGSGVHAVNTVNEKVAEATKRSSIRAR